MNVRKLVYLTNVEGIRLKGDDPGSLIRQVDVNQLSQLVDSGVVYGGMIPKVLSCLDAIKNGVKSAHILNGTRAHSLLVEIFTDQGIGTMIRSNLGEEKVDL